MGVIREQCNVCGKTFDVVFRYQMEERDGGFVFFCSQRCLGRSHATPQEGEHSATCDACAKHFRVTLASQVLYTDDQRRYACSMACRTQLVREASGVRLGEIAVEGDDVDDGAELTATETAATEADAASPSGEPAVELAAPGERVSEVRAVPATNAAMPAADPTASRPARRADDPPPGAREETDAAKVRVGPRRIAVFNHKGGTGKTTTSVSLAAGLADRGSRVLLVDTDSQGNVAVSLGASCERSLYHVLVMGLRVADATFSVRPGLDLLPSNETLAAAELYLAGRQNRDRVLSQRMGAAADAYDYVVIDCSPSLSLMNQNALVFADSVLVPVACDYLSLVGVRQVIKTVKNVNTLLRHKLKIWGVLPTFYDGRHKICAEALRTLRSHFGERCLQPIRATTKLKEAPAQARSIFEHAPGAHGAIDYTALVDAVVGAGGGRSVSERKQASAGSPPSGLGVPWREHTEAMT